LNNLINKIEHLSLNYILLLFSGLNKIVSVASRCPGVIVAD
jgi:hypothetical protein